MIPLFDTHQVREADIFASKELGISGLVLMENAARSIYDHIVNTFETLNKILPIGIICGKGNNGGDGYALARQLLINGYTVKVVSVNNPAELKGDAQINFKVFEKLVNYYPKSGHIAYMDMKDIDKLTGSQILVDAILGTGTKGEINEPLIGIIKKLNSINCFKVAVDVPSGLQTDSSSGDNIFNADLTISLVELKSGLFYGKGYKYGGKIVKGSIGIGSEYFDQLAVNKYLVEPEDALLGIPKREKDAHKYSAGKLLIIAGSGEYPGAAALSANAAIRSGAGAVVLAFPKSLSCIIHSKLNEVTVLAYDDQNSGHLTNNCVNELQIKIEWADAVLIGPGLGRNVETIEAVNSILKNNRDKRFVIDADAVYALSRGNRDLNKLKNSVLIPHHGEFADLLGIEVSQLNSDILKYGSEFVSFSKNHLILKGAPSILLNPGNEIFINSTGNQALAKFGSGDVFAGILGSFIAANKEIENSAIAASFIHGLLADLLIEEKTELSVTSTDLIGKIPDAIKFLRKSII